MTFEMMFAKNEVSVSTSPSRPRLFKCATPSVFRPIVKLLGSHAVSPALRAKRGKSLANSHI